MPFPGLVNSGDIISASHINAIRNALITWPGDVSAGGFNLTNLNALGVATITATGIITATSKGHRLGAHGGTAYSGALTQADANVVLYSGGANNWAGIGTDSNGVLWFRTGLSGTPAARMAIRTDGVIEIGGAVAASGNVLSNAGHIESVGTFGSLRITQGAGISFRWTLNNDGSAYFQRTNDNYTANFVTSIQVLGDGNVRLHIAGGLRNLTVDGSGFVKVV